MKQYNYDFSVVMAVYNTEKYLREAVESLVRQTIGFSNIQLIMVDDGSKDKSGAICDDYKKKYPGNVVVIHKENEGVSSARNSGLKYVQGKYINFLDSDDILDSKAMSETKSFMDQHEEVDVCCIPIVFFGEREGDHPLNGKFSEGTKVADLTKDAECILLHTSSAFFRAEKTKEILFDTRLRFAEDAKRNLQVLMDNPNLGIVADTKYHYRKHGNSALDGSVKNPYWYLPSLQFFAKWALDSAEKKWGIIPRWIQNTVMYDQQWRIHQSRIPNGVLSKEESDEYKALLFEVVCRIDDDIIVNQKHLSIEDIVFVLTKKYNKSPIVRMRKDMYAERQVKTDIKKHNCVVGVPVLRFGIKTIIDTSNMITVWEFLTINESQKTCTIEGYHRICGLKDFRIRPFLLVDGKIVSCTMVDRSRKNQIVLEETAGLVIGFKATFPLQNRNRQIIPGLLIDQTLVLRREYQFGSFFPVSEVYKNGHALINDYWIIVKNGAVYISQKPMLPARMLQEGRLLAEIWKKNYLGGRKAVGGRLFYHLFKLFKRKNLWIISDRIMKADDNGEALYRYLQEHSLKNTHVVFSLSKNSSDYARMLAVGECIDSMSFKHKLLHLLCDVNISTQAEDVTINPYAGHHEALRDLLIHQKFIFLQHGVIKDDLSEWLNRYNKNISGFITSAPAEQASVQYGEYDYKPETIWLTGLPRFDRLYHDEKKRVTIMPSWRRYLMGSIDGKTGAWQIDENWKDSRYYRFYNELLNSDLLLQKFEQYGYQLQFFPHPNLQPFMNAFHHDSRVVFLPQTTSYRDIYANSDLVITDYSSAVFDFAYLRKPIVYCQFDKEEFFSGEHVYTKGYFEYERDGFGEVVYNLEETVRIIIEYIAAGCELKDVYRQRIDDFFAYNDQENCRRVVEKILSLPGNG